ncbi:hypothetical protein [Marinomonas mediterranea]|jgi:hypothetical protein|uniref:Uncharacterized protein n=1 Tax=Marinomonas mediterranea (strain ATCC 700492 / JCM 21426 / NBRC 103028 / MMB-1) TaxID=717774 RepID=F2JZI2_MARM1|nr:hypothetical protein [Marinomonas mediterranea]ADZ89765.1 hypothetical protein Marme_0469 [Marinomonas mediterranea MMB-1]WCN07855.1 hypothetical protein GV055_02395 [Marinomonas mediterranea]WCN11950.1 hypothetical protein GV054_02405 [Marinomonas mediterranea]WCN15988.1 hypothetical protein GV053_02335 [Marinomonas mediterranea MMB-1]
MDLRVAILLILGLMLIAKLIYLSRVKARKKNALSKASQTCEKQEGEKKHGHHAN